MPSQVLVANVDTVVFTPPKIDLTSIRTPVLAPGFADGKVSLDTTGTVQRYGQAVMTRIVAGTLGGRRLSAPPGAGTRPTSDRVREALFSSIESMVELDGSRFADLFAGSGAVGFEALSRGAAHVLLVESDARAARTIRANLAALDAAPAARLVSDRVAAVLDRGPEGDPYDVVFADPPYAMPDEEIAAMVAALVDGGWLAPDAVLVVERSSRGGPPPQVEGVTPVRSRRYGETTLWYGRRS
ncbi:DNA methylase [Asanoa iriomotensis]|uniref:DNA methylase n=2 Tax=Asanoa iriomotensis TaxID=234613 RepID=A0ABQ4C950_9ACTN|nr:DNA methylase [Asanoa iriomotensis]